MSFRGVAAMSDFWKVVREFNPEGIERDATSLIDLLIVGESGSGKRTIANSLVGTNNGDSSSYFELIDLDTASVQPSRFDKADLVILAVRLDQDLADASRRMSDLFKQAKTSTILVFTHADKVQYNRDLRNMAFRSFSFVSHLKTIFIDASDPLEVRSKLLPLILETVPNLRTSLARKLPAARGLVAEQVIAETSRVNAQFALAANLPANLPLFGSVAGSVADFFVLTKNQVMMVLRLAAIYGRDISLTLQIAAEIAPIIGGGLLWRTAARLAVGLLPSFLAAAPKTAIAYVGTYIAGHAARYYYDQGCKPPKHLLESFAAEGANMFHRMMARENNQ